MAYSLKRRETRRPKSLLAQLGLWSVLGTICIFVLLLFAPRWLYVERLLPEADWIVVLGGESGERVIGAAELYHQGVAPKIFVSGSGDCLVIVRRLEMAGVPSSAIRYECESRNTHENAVRTRAALAEAQPQKAVIVTTWHHTFRALRTFRQVWPEVMWGTQGVYPGLHVAQFPLYEVGNILAEYCKIVVNFFRYELFSSHLFSQNT